jgi:hypothetical protein
MRGLGLDIPSISVMITPDISRYLTRESVGCEQMMLV